MENDIFYYVHGGDLCSGTMLGRVTIDVQSDSCMHREELMDSVLDQSIIKHVPENGKYAVMTGQHVVPFHQLYRSKEEAADAYRDQLITGYYNDRVR